MLNDLEQHLQSNLLALNGSWLSKKSSYEDAICNALDMELSKSRYWDATWRNHHIEFKKGRSIWLDLVRYSEILLESDKQASRETICLFFIPDKRKKQIQTVICVKTAALIEKIGLTEPQAEFLAQMNKAVPRSLNAQASLTVKDVENIKVFSVQ